jgi:hypothetical protein
MNATTISPDLATLPQRATATAADAELAANSALLVAQAFTIDSPEVYEAAGAELRDIATRMKRLEDARLSITRPMDEAKKAVMALFAKPLETLQKADGVLRASMLTWKRAEDERIARERAEAERIAREEREAAQRAAAEAAARAAELAAQANNSAEAEDAAREAAAQAEAAAEEAALAEVAPPPVVAEPTAKAAGVASRKVWKAEVVDFAALVKAAAQDPTLLAYLEVNTTALNGVAKAMKDAARIPGVRVYADETLAVRRA